MLYHEKITTLLAASALLVASSSDAQEEQTAQSLNQPQFVKTLVVPSAQNTVVRQFFGQLRALETVNVSFEVGGHLEILQAREGQFVAAGTLLAQLDLAPFERSVERAELALEQAERSLTRAQTLASRNVASEVQAEDAETARNLADVALRDAKAALQDAQIFAPFDGIVADRIGTAFSNVEPGTPILRLHNMSEVRVEFDLPERLLSEIGDPELVVFDGQLAGEVTRLPLEFREFRAETSRIGQSYQISLALDQEADGTLLPGRTMVVHAHIPQQQDGVVLPATAVRTRPNREHVAVALIAEGGAFRARHISVEVSSANGTEFLVTGLEAGTEIVQVGAHKIDDGAIVKRFTGLIQEGL